MATCNIDLTVFISRVWDSISQRRGYFSNPENKIKDLTKALELLKSTRNDKNNQLSSHELLGETCLQQVRLLLDSVASIEGEVNRMVLDYEQRRCLGGCSINFWCINRRAIHKLARVVALREQINQLEVLTARLPPPPVQEMPRTSTVVGMESNLDEVLRYLHDDHVGIIGIWGMGGVGKTSLLNSINNNFLSGQRSAMFDHVIWATVSKEYTVNQFQDEIASRLFPEKIANNRLLDGMRPPDNKREKATEREQAAAIFNHLNCRNFLLLLDDLWQKVDLEAVGVPIPFKRPIGQCKHKVVFTTRMEQVCGSMGAHKKIKINCLDEKDAWQLFWEMVGQDTLESDPRIRRLARKVVEECRGLPLALTVIGKALSTRKTPNEWQDAIALLRSSKLPEILEKDEEMFPRLKLSYDYLPDDAIRKCFLLCALWPEDYNIWKRHLIECWMGHGLIDVGAFNDINEAYDRGHAIIGKLKSACLLEPGNDEAKEVKMHDIIGDMARWIASDGNKKNQKLIVQSGDTFCRSPADLKVWATAEHVSLIKTEIREFPGAPPDECPNLITLMLKRNFSLKLIPRNFFVSFPALTFLDLSEAPITELPPEISRAKNLQYLDLSFTKITRLPESLRYLSKLRFLFLRGLFYLTEVPQGVISNLSMLEVLDLERTLTPYEYWVEIEALTKGLKALGITVETVEAIERLSQLCDVMMWHLCIWKLLHLSQPHQLLLPNLLSTHNMSSSLEWLWIGECESVEEVIMEKGGDIVKQNCCLPKLQNLTLHTLTELKKISWRGLDPWTYFPTLTHLYVYNCDKLKNVTWVLKLEYLKLLRLWNCKEMERLIDDLDETDAATDLAFPSLETIELYNMPNLTIICRSRSTFPSLELLYVNGCPALKSLPFSSETPKNKLRIEGEPEWWDKLEWKDGDLQSSLQPCFKRT